MCCHKEEYNPFAGTSPLPTNGGCCEPISSGSMYVSHQYAIGISIHGVQSLISIEHCTYVNNNNNNNNNNVPLIKNGSNANKMCFTKLSHALK